MKKKLPTLDLLTAAVSLVLPSHQIVVPTIILPMSTHGFSHKMIPGGQAKN